MQSLFTPIVITLLFLMTSIQNSHSQTDSTRVPTEDIIHLKDGSIIKGDILSFNESNGVIVLKDSEGRTYTFDRDDYEYYEENIQIIKKREKRIIKERKTDELGLQVGVSVSSISITDEDPSSDYDYLSSTYYDTPVSLIIGIGKYIQSNHYVGLTSEFALASDTKNYFNIGARYSYLYNTKKNVTFYLPVELKFSNSDIDMPYDTLANEVWYNYRDQFKSGVAIQSLEFNIGQGVSFAMSKKKTLNIEVKFIKRNPLLYTFEESAWKPNESDFTITGGAFSIFLIF